MSNVRKKTLAKQQARQHYKKEKYLDRNLNQQVRKYNKLASKYGSQLLTRDLAKGLADNDKQGFLNFLKAQNEQSFKRTLPMGKNAKMKAPLESAYNLDFYISSVISNIRADEYKKRSELPAKSRGQVIDDFNKRNIYKQTTEDMLRSKRVGYRGMTKKKHTQFYETAKQLLQPNTTTFSQHNHIANMQKAIREKFIGNDVDELLQLMSEKISKYGVGAVSDAFISEVQDPFDIVYFETTNSYDNALDDIKSILNSVGE